MSEPPPLAAIEQALERAPREALRWLFTGRPAVLDRLAAQVERAIGATQPVLLEGERGAGKSLVAAVIHHAGGKRRGALARLEPGEGPGAVARAVAPGTLVIDEVAASSVEVQEALLRLLRGAGPAPRVLATTSLDLDAAVGAGWFLPDLRDRLRVLRLVLPPLRETRTAIGELFLALLTARSAPAEPPVVAPSAVAALRAYPWPGNVRELDLAARTLRAWCPRGPLEAAHVGRFLAQLATDAAPRTASPGPAAAREETLVEVERAAIEARLVQHGWRQVETAKSLGIDRKTLYRKIRDLGLTPPT